jgi:hypothetical protein
MDAVVKDFVGLESLAGSLFEYVRSFVSFYFQNTVMF